MPKYKVTMECKARVYIIVQAENPDGAYDKAFEIMHEALNDAEGVDFVDLDCLEREVEETDYA